MRAAGELDLDRLRRWDTAGLLEGIDRAVVFDLPMRLSMRGIIRRDGILLHGPAGWGEVAPFWNYDSAASAPWLASALEQAQQGYDGLPLHREQIPVNVTIPEVSPYEAARLVRLSGARTAKVKVGGAVPGRGARVPSPVGTSVSGPVTAGAPSASVSDAVRGRHAAAVTAPAAGSTGAMRRVDRPVSERTIRPAGRRVADNSVADEATGAIPTRRGRRVAERTAAAGRHASTSAASVPMTPQLREDLERLEAVREALGPDGHIRVDVNGAWDVEAAAAIIPQMDRAAGGLQYVEQPCATVEELAALRRYVDVPIAADESVRLAADPLAVKRLEAADVVVLKAAPLGGVRRGLALADKLELPVVVSSAVDTSVGIYAGVRLAAGLAELGLACGLGTGTFFEMDPAVPPLLPESGMLNLRSPHVSTTMLTGVAADSETSIRWNQRLGHLLGALSARRAAEAADPATAIAGLPL